MFCTHFRHEFVSSLRSSDNRFRPGSIPLRSDQADLCTLFLTRSRVNSDKRQVHDRNELGLGIVLLCAISRQGRCIIVILYLYINCYDLYSAGKRNPCLICGNSAEASTQLSTLMSSICNWNDDFSHRVDTYRTRTGRCKHCGKPVLYLKFGFQFASHEQTWPVENQL